MNDIRKIDMDKQQLYPLRQLHAARTVLKDIGGMIDAEIRDLILFGECTCQTDSAEAAADLYARLDSLGLRLRTTGPVEGMDSTVYSIKVIL